MSGPLHQTKESRQQRKLGPFGAIVFFVLVVLLTRGMAALVHALGLEKLSIMTEPGFAQLPIVPLAYAFYPQAFSKRFWHLPRNTWDWLFGLAVLETIGLLIGYSAASVSRRVAFGTVLLGPLLEEIARAVLLSPILERWGRLWAIVITSVLTALAHPDPVHVALLVTLLTIMFVSTDRSIPATTLGHVLMNAFVVFAGGIEG